MDCIFLTCSSKLTPWIFSNTSPVVYILAHGIIMAYFILTECSAAKASNFYLKFFDVITVLENTRRE
jgi:hypothetical protein